MIDNVSPRIRVQLVDGNICPQQSIYVEDRSARLAMAENPLALNMRPLWYLTLGLLTLSTGYAIVFSLPSGLAAMEWANATFPIILMFGLCAAATLLIHRNPLMVWSPLTLFFLVASIYYGVGPLVYSYGNPRIVANGDLFYPLDTQGLLRVNLLDTFGIALVVSGFIGGWTALNRQHSYRIRMATDRSIRSVAFLFAILGTAIKYLFILPNSFGWNNIVIPTSLAQLSTFSLLAIIPLLVLVKKGDKTSKTVIIVLVTSEIISSIVRFSKLEFLLTPLIVIMGLFFCYRRLKILVAGFFCLLIIFLTIVPLVSFGRSEIRDMDAPGLSDRIEIIYDFFSLIQMDALVSETTTEQGWWGRITYANSQKFALDQYDMGCPGDSMERILYIFVPRSIWPEKPILSDVGTKFNFLVNRNDSSASSPGFFGAEAYWNGGYLLTILICFMEGIIFAAFTRYSFLKMNQNDFLFLPVVFTGIMAGIRPDDWSILIFGGIAIAVVTHYVLKYVQRAFLKFISL